MGITSADPFVDLDTGVNLTGIRGDKVGGDGGYATITLRNVGNVTAMGTARVVLQAVPHDGGAVIDLGDPGDCPVYLPAGFFRPYRVKYELPFDITTDDYDVIASIVSYDPANGLDDVNDENDSYRYPYETYTFAQAELDLAAAFGYVGLSDPYIAGQPFQRKAVYVRVGNEGNRTFRSDVEIDVYACPSGSFDPGEAVLVGELDATTPPLRPGGGVQYYMRGIEIPADIAGGEYYLYAEVQHADADLRPLDPQEAPEGANIARTGGTVTIAEPFGDLRADVAYSFSVYAPGGQVVPGRSSGVTGVFVYNEGNARITGSAQVDVFLQRRDNGARVLLDSQTVDYSSFLHGYRSAVSRYDMPDGMPEGEFDVLAEVTPLQQHYGKADPAANNTDTADRPVISAGSSRTYNLAGDQARPAGSVEWDLAVLWSKAYGTTATVGDPVLGGRYRSWLQFGYDQHFWTGRDDLVVDDVALNLHVTERNTDEGLLTVQDLHETLDDSPFANPAVADLTGVQIWDGFGGADVLHQGPAPGSTGWQSFDLDASVVAGVSRPDDLALGLRQRDNDDEFQFTIAGPYAPTLEVRYHDAAWD